MSKISAAGHRVIPCRAKPLSVRVSEVDTQECYIDQTVTVYLSDYP